MKKFILIAIILFIVLAIYFIFSKNNTNLPIPPTATTTTQPETTSDVSASFEIYANGTKRIFTDKRYHNLNEEVFIDPQEPNIVQVKRLGITWDDFFKTLPMSLSADCLVTGTKQTFCTGDGKSLKFYINGKLTPDALSKPIIQGEGLKVIFE